MRKPHVNCMLVLAFLAGGCGATRPAHERNTFGFAYGTDHYEIVSTVAPADRANNYLVRRTGEQILLSARDDDQDGRLDTILAGSITLEQANEIYAAGIAEARSSGDFAARRNTRVHEVYMPGGAYAVETYLLDAGRVYNRFFLADLGCPAETVLLDDGADGTLDRVERGACPLEKSQRAYAMVLAGGQRAGRIEAREGRYLVRPSRMR